MPKVKSRTRLVPATPPGCWRGSSADAVASSSSDPPKTSLRTLVRMPRHSSCGATENKGREEDIEYPDGGRARMQRSHAARRAWPSALAAGSRRSRRATGCPTRSSTRSSQDAAARASTRRTASRTPAVEGRGMHRAQGRACLPAYRGCLTRTQERVRWSVCPPTAPAERTGALVTVSPRVHTPR